MSEIIRRDAIKRDESAQLSMETRPCNLFSWSDLRQQRSLQFHIKAGNYCFVWSVVGVWNATPTTQSGPNYKQFNNIPPANLLYYNSLKFTIALAQLFFN